MASTRAAPVASWSVIAVVALMAGALLVTAWTTRASVRDARDTLLRGERDAAEQAVRADLAELGAAPTADDLAAILAEHRDAGLRYVALVDGGAVVASAGTPDPDHERVELHGPRRPGAFGHLHHVARASVVIELEPTEAEELDEAATRTLGIGAAAAAVLLVVASLLIRWVVRREARERDRERERRLASLGELSAVLAHEIRNPLASLKGNAQLLAAALPAGEKPRQKAERVVAEAVRLEQLTTDLLAFVRTGELHASDVDPAALLRDAAAAASPGEAAEAPEDTGAAAEAPADADASASAAITVDVAGAPPTWRLDAGRVRQVLANLLDNAVAAGPPVRARVAAAGDRLVFEIDDHGPGVAPADAERIFEPFFTRKTSGTGLGLAVARRVVELHGGTITVGAAPGGGARFRVELPRAPRAA